MCNGETRDARTRIRAKTVEQVPSQGDVNQVSAQRPLRETISTLGYFRRRRSSPRARPRFSHTPPAFAITGKPLKVTLQVRGAKTAAIRLHYRMLNQTETFHTLEGGPSFTLPGEHISARFDLMYYFGVLNAEKTGWFYPDPATSTQYFVVETRTERKRLGGTVFP
jgi:hypothetical protein